MSLADVSPMRLSAAWRQCAASIAVAILFFLAARLSLSLVDKVDGVAVFWLAAGVASGFLVAFGPTMRWPVVIGVASATFAANLLGDRNLASSSFFCRGQCGWTAHRRRAHPADLCQAIRAQRTASRLWIVRRHDSCGYFYRYRRHARIFILSPLGFLRHDDMASVVRD
jgi:hypothetical protein